jgi:prolipoprotein diacylglyceryltransferase
VQLYESLTYLLIFFILYWVYWKTDLRKKPGYIFGLFLALLFSARFFLEFFKASQGGFETAFGNALSTGQLLSIPFVLGGLFFMFRPVERRPTQVRPTKTPTGGKKKK